MEKMNNEYTLKFTKRELLILYNIILFEDELAADGCRQPNKYTIGDAAAIAPILDKLHPYVVVETNIPEGTQGVPQEEQNTPPAGLDLGGGETHES